MNQSDVNYQAIPSSHAHPTTNVITVIGKPTAEVVPETNACFRLRGFDHDDVGDAAGHGQIAGEG